MENHVLLIGATLLDTKGKPTAGLAPGTSNPAGIKHTRGGTARNVAENLARYEANAKLISAVGDDYTGRLLLGQTAESGVDVSPSMRIPEARTGSYIAILDDLGSLSVALDDVGVMSHINPGYLRQQRPLFQTAGMVLIDGSLTPDALETAIQLTVEAKVPLAVDPSSSRLAANIIPYLSHISLLVPNEMEAATLINDDYWEYGPDHSIEAAQELVSQGVGMAAITMRDFGLAYATTDETGYIPPSFFEKVDTTGTGDAATAAIMYGLLEGLPATEAFRLGAAAASLTLQTTETVVPNLNLDMLYDHLIV